MGGNQGDTYFNAIDANLASDVLAAGGHTYDHEITGTSTPSQLPLIVVYKILTKDIRWMKTDTSKAGYTTRTISLSPNGNFLIGLLIPASLGTEFFQVYNSFTGNQLSSRKYDTASYDLEANRRSLLINSSGTAAYATGIHLISNYAFILRYNPIDISSTAPIWQK